MEHDPRPVFSGRHSDRVLELERSFGDIGNMSILEALGSRTTGKVWPVSRQRAEDRMETSVSVSLGITTNSGFVSVCHRLSRACWSLALCVGLVLPPSLRWMFFPCSAVCSPRLSLLKSSCGSLEPLSHHTRDHTWTKPHRVPCTQSASRPGGSAEAYHFMMFVTIEARSTCDVTYVCLASGHVDRKLRIAISSGCLHDRGF